MRATKCLLTSRLRDSGSHRALGATFRIIIIISECSEFVERRQLLIKASLFKRRKPRAEFMRTDLAFDHFSCPSGGVKRAWRKFLVLLDFLGELCDPRLAVVLSEFALRKCIRDVPKIW